jgi:hypothetical protein
MIVPVNIFVNCMSSGHGTRRFKKAAHETARGNPKERRMDNKDHAHEERVKG